MLACTSDQASPSQEDVAVGYTHSSSWRNATAVRCRNLLLRNDPAVAILSALSSQTSQISSGESLPSMDACQASDINIWVYRTNNTIDSEAILEVSNPTSFHPSSTHALTNHNSHGALTNRSTSPHHPHPRLQDLEQSPPSSPPSSATSPLVSSTPPPAL